MILSIGTLISVFSSTSRSQSPRTAVQRLASGRLNKSLRTSVACGRSESLYETEQEEKLTCWYSVPQWGSTEVVLERLRTSVLSGRILDEGAGGIPVKEKSVIKKKSTCVQSLVLSDLRVKLYSPYFKWWKTEEHRLERLLLQKKSDVGPKSKISNGKGTRKLFLNVRSRLENEE